MPTHDSHCVDLGFAFTFYKVQGATLKNVVLDFNFQTNIECKFSSIYVGLSRVRTVESMALLPLTVAATTMLTRAGWPKDLRQWMAAANAMSVLKEMPRQ